MMTGRAVNCRVGETELTLFLNGAAMFGAAEIAARAAAARPAPEQGEELPGYDSIDLILDLRREVFPHWCALVALLAEQGELARRAAGYDPRPMIGPEQLELMLAPCDIDTLQVAAGNALAMGYQREFKPEADVDLDLIEFKKKQALA